MAFQSNDERIGATIAVLSQHYCSVGELAELLGTSEEAARTSWQKANPLRFLTGRSAVPYRSDTVGRPPYMSGLAPFLNGWYSKTVKLDCLLERFLVNEALGGHYCSVLHAPEGGHFVLSLAASQVTAILADEYRIKDSERIQAVAVGACPAADDVERVAANACRVLLDIVSYRDEPMTPELFISLYDALMQGVGMPVLEQCEETRRNSLLQTISNMLQGSCKVDRRDSEVEAHGAPAAHHVLIGAVLAHAAFVCCEPFSTMNRIFAYVAYVLTLHRAGCHVSCHAPCVDALGQGGLLRRGMSCEDLAMGGLAAGDTAPVEWTGYLETAVTSLLENQEYVMTKLDGMARKRKRLQAILSADETLNRRQKDVLLEAILHSNAEFSYAVHEERYGVSYLSARSDFLRLLDLGFLKKCDDGIRHFFIACDDIAERARAYLLRQCPTEYARYYKEDGTLRWEHRATVGVCESLNSGVGFYERELVEETYNEHLASRREPIARQDGPRHHEKVPLGAAPFADAAVTPSPSDSIARQTNAGHGMPCRSQTEGEVGSKRAIG